MTAHDNNQIPLLTKISRKKLRRQKAEEETFATDGNVAVNGNKERRVTYSRSDSVKERYDRVGGANNIRIYNHELLQAAEDKNYDKCKDLLEKGANVNIADEETECTALHIACKNDSYDILRLCLAKGANCNAQDKTEQTPLHLAVRKDHRLCCQILLDCQDLQINLYNKTYDTPLHVAAKEGRYEISKLILQHKEAKVNAKNKKGMNSLHYAAQESQVSILKLLLDNNANWKQQDNQSYLPLHYAAQKGYPECCSTLIANVDEDNQNKALSISTRDGKTPLMLAAKGGHHRCCEVMQYGNINAKDKDGNTALHYAAQGGFDFTVIELLNAGADPNTQNKKGCSPMLEAAGKKKFGCLKILAEKGENLNVSDKQKKNVLHYAAERNALEALRFLLKYQVLKNIIDAEDRSYYTPLHLAIKRDADECALLLLEHGASPVKKSASGMTPLHLAADKGSISVCEVLLSRKEVQVSQENDAKATPLHMAALRGSVDVCQMLIRKGARITAVDDKGRTALHVASAEGHEKAVKFLSKRGISLRAKDDTGSSALHLAAFKGSLPCCKILVDCAKAACWEVDQNNDLPLDKAFKELDDKLAQSSLSDHDHVFKFLLENLCFKEHHEGRMLRIHKYMDTALNDRRSIIIDAIVSSCWWRAGVSGEKGHQCQNFRKLIEMYPQIALKLQDKCITRGDKNKSEIIYDFRLLEDNYYIPSAPGPLCACPFDPETHRVMRNAKAFTEDDLEWKQNHPLTKMISHQRHQLLQHRLTKTWLLQKWRSYIYVIFLILLSIEVFFTLSLVIFMGITDNWLHVEKNCNISQEEFCSTYQNLSCDIFDKRENSASENDTSLHQNRSLTADIDDKCNVCNKNAVVKQVLWYLLSALTCLNLLLELNYVWRLKKEYFFQIGHIIQVSKLLFTLAVLLPKEGCEFHYVILSVTRWQFGIIALLLTWLHLINTLNQLPMLSVFMPLTGSFAKSFFKVIFYIIMIVFVFAFIFHLLLKNQEGFSTVPQAMVKAIVWMLGDLGYDDTFLDKEKVLYYPVMVNIFFVMFVTILGGFIANLVITQPANKLESFRDKASFHRAASRTQLFLKLDVCFPFFRKRRMAGKYIEDESRNLDSNYLTKKLLMLDAKEDIQPEEDSASLQVQLEELQKIFTQFLAQHNEFREEIRDMKYQINTISKALLE